MIREPLAHLSEHRESLYVLFRHYANLSKPFLLQSEIWDGFEAIFPDDAGDEGKWLREFIVRCQEAAVSKPWLVLAVRPQIGRWFFVRFHIEEMAAEVISAAEYLAFREDLVAGQTGIRQPYQVEIDLAPFNREFPRLKEAKSIGRGVEFLNRHLSSRLFVDLGKGDKALLRFLQLHQQGGRQLMLHPRLQEVSDLRSAISQALELLHRRSDATPWTEIESDLRQLGFESGWGRTVLHVRETMGLLLDILEAPEPKNLERFLGRVPMIFSIAIISPHGFFGQSNVLGLPDTGGQVVYILDQVRALEAEMQRRLDDQGLDIEPRVLIVTRLIPESRNTTCNQRLEHVMGTSNVQILRVPFRDPSGSVVPHWISRFQVWPYLEDFAEEAQREIIAELGSKPDLIIGNYSDGNLVASLIAQNLHVTQCNIAHALEKTKYLHSDLYWRENESSYHFSCQFTADLVAMNTADFIVTSTYQEIAGTDQSVGQYESYRTFTMPGLYRVTEGIDLYDPRFNIVSPGASPETFFPYTDESRRLRGLETEIEELIFGTEPRADARGVLADREKPIIFTLARLDRIKNLTGLVEWYAKNERLRELANVVVVAGHVRPEDCQDAEESEQNAKMHALFDTHQLDDHVRWLGLLLEKKLSGELYRYIAERRGIFVQPALFEAFGLTVIEGMVSGLPTFATRYGGPLEIIEHGVSGFHIDPNHGKSAAELIAEFLEECQQNPERWDEVSQGGIRRVEDRYTWKLYAERMMTLSRIYGFWHYVTNLERQETRRYLELLYGLLYRPLAERLRNET